MDEKKDIGGIGVNEKDLAILEQYELRVTDVRRGRGSFLCETDRGLVQVTEFSGSKERLFFQNRVLHFLKEQGMRADVILENKEGNLVSLDRYENAYVVKEWFQGRECDTKNQEEIQAAVRYMAQMHQALRLPKWTPNETSAEKAGEKAEDRTEEKIEEKIEEKTVENSAGFAEETKELRMDLEYSGESLEQEMRRHTREMKKVRNFMRSRRKKTPFELKFLEVYPMFEEQALKAQERLDASGAEKLYDRCIRERRIRHGDYSQHNLLFDRRGAVAVNFSKCCFDVQTADFYQFFRKIMEKQSWNPRTGMDMLRAYETARSLEKAEFEDFCVRLAYPEKFWKLANHYFNSRKTWIPEKNLQKLEMLIAQEKRRGDFVKFLH